MNCDFETSLKNVQHSDPTMVSELEYARRETVRLLLERDEAKEFCSRLANAVYLCFYKQGSRQVVSEILEEYFSDKKTRP